MHLHVLAEDEQGEAIGTGRLLRDGHELRGYARSAERVAIPYRTNFQSRQIEEALRRTKGNKQAAARLLEENACFNAGRGSVLTEHGEVELDAAIMDGATLLGTGAVADACARIALEQAPGKQGAYAARQVAVNSTARA